MLEFTTEDLVRIFGPLATAVFGLITIIYRKRKSIMVWFGIILSLFDSSELKKKLIEIEERNKELQDQCARLSEYAMSLRDDPKLKSSIPDLIEDKNPAAKFIDEIKTEDTRRNFYLTLVFPKSLMVVPSDPFKEYLLFFAENLRGKNVADRRFIFNFTETEFFSSVAYGAIFRFLEYFKDNNGFELIFIPPNKDGKEIFKQQLAALSKEITNFKIEAVKDEIVFP